MSVQVSFFDAREHPDHGRPRVAAFVGAQGEADLHADRESGALWVFAQGPRGGSLGQAVFPPVHADRVLAWLDGDARGAAPSTMGALWLEPLAVGCSLVVANRAGLRRKLVLVLDHAAERTFRECLRTWATMAQAGASMLVPHQYPPARGWVSERG
jgi:hypothetical protein